jgi:protein O-GlcNAc transferase
VQVIFKMRRRYVEVSSKIHSSHTIANSSLNNQDKPPDQNTRQQLESALAHQDAGRIDVAIKTYQSVLSHSPRNANAHHLLGALLFQSGRDPKNGLAHVQQATEIDDDRPDHHNTLGVLYRSLKQSDQSVSSLKRAISLVPDYAEAWNNLGATYEDSNDPIASTKAYETALRHAPEYFQAAINLGRLCLHQAAYDHATETYKLAVELAPNNEEALFGYGLVLENPSSHTKCIIFRRGCELVEDLVG